MACDSEDMIDMDRMMRRTGASKVVNAYYSVLSGAGNRQTVVVAERGGDG